MDPLVSIVIPCYNAEKWIGAAISSCLQQTYQPLEIIVVDDGSTDNSVQAIKDHFPFATLISEECQNRGPGFARNVGWRHSNGVWIQFLDADDLLHPEKIARQFEVAAELSDQVAVVYSDWQRLALVDRRWRLVGNVASPNLGEDVVAGLLETDNFLQLGSLLIRRSWLEKVGGFDERHWLIEDVHLLLRIAMDAGRFHCVQTDVPLSFYRQHNGGSLSSRDSREFVEGCLRNGSMVEAYWRSRGELTPQRIALLSRNYFQGARYFAGTDPQAFEATVRKIESLAPDWLPPGPKHLRWLSQAIGYRRAEKVAVLYRRAKAVLK